MMYSFSLFIYHHLLSKATVQIVQIESTTEDEGSEVQSSKVSLVVRVQERFGFTWPGAEEAAVMHTMCVSWSV